MPLRALRAGLLAGLWGLSDWTPSRGLDFEARVEAQRAIERIYYAHQLGATLPFEQAVPETVIRQKVESYLRQSVALEEYWGVRVRAEEIEEELERIAARTRLPNRLLEVYEALGNDPLVIQECFVRPVLVDRLARTRFESDFRIHGEASEQAESLREKLLTGAVDPSDESPLRSVLEVRLADKREQEADLAAAARWLPPDEYARARALAPAAVGEPSPVEQHTDSYVIRVVLEEDEDSFRMAHFRVPRTSWDEWWASAWDRFDVSKARTAALAGLELARPAGAAVMSTLPCALDDTWDSSALDALPEPRSSHTAVWTGSVMVVWAGTLSGFATTNTGGRYDPTTDTWRATSRVGAPAARTGHSAVWSGQEMIIWGGSGPRGDGGRYDPVNDLWRPLSTTDAPSPRAAHAAVWTGSRMIVWGGTDGAYLNSGGVYDPAGDSWAPISTLNAPPGRRNHTSVWTGDTMVVWGGSNGAQLADGGRYQPATDGWSPVTLVNAPEPRERHTAIWTDSRMIVWGGSAGQDTYFATGGSYDPISDTWTPTGTASAPPGRHGHTAVWTGSRMLIWGGANRLTTFNSGARYDPAADVWSAISTVGAPQPHSIHTAVWTGSLMVIWGGLTYYDEENLAGRYDPVADVWLAPSMNHPPDGRENHRAVWTGNIMLIWGGSNTDFYLGAGASYDPLTDTWSPISRLGEPAGRVYFTAVWTGRYMVVWGGWSPGTWHNSGGRYDPIADVWFSTATNGAPVGRQDHTAVWTGREMLVWGGAFVGPPTTLVNSGGSYEPDTDTWTAIASGGAPLARYRHTAIWTGQEMVVWGGYSAGYLNTGGRYDPRTASWRATSTLNAPSGRFLFASVWTSREMMVWGGYNGTYLNSGGRYDPALDQWSATTLTGAPSPRESHSIVWTGSLAVIWGGDRDPLYVFNGDGDRYDPVTDSWTPVSTAMGPRARTRHSAVWTGNFMMVWGGYSFSRLYSGGRYIVAPRIDHDADGVMVCEGDCDDADAMTYPGAAQVCDGRNNDCLAAGWPSLAGTNEADDDGDLMSECQGDCDDSNTLVWSSPGEVHDLDLALDAMTISWGPPAQPGGNLIFYDTLRSPQASDFFNGTICVESGDGSDTRAIDVAAPGPGQIVYYLARAENACPGGSGPLGTDSSGSPRSGRSCP